MKRLYDNKIDKQILCNAALRLDLSFYQRNNVQHIAKELLGKILVTRFNNIVTAARVVETEAYNGLIDKASHAFGGRRTKRTEIMYRQGRIAYIYLCYGIHYLFNVVTNIEDVPHAVLIRAAEPVSGTETMMERTGKPHPGETITKGPGNLARALGINRQHNGMGLLSHEIYFIDDGYKLETNKIISSPRIGVAYAAEDALLPYRYYIKGNVFVSGKRISER
ncbi:MAG TPA: DNA-3-methyladenine glycosylase [Panacibacter sp.]|nr:DNA-3-methyladenine glycosylase [Panacibacter sp.]